MKFSFKSLYLSLFILQIFFSILIISDLSLFGFIPFFLLTYFLVIPGFLILRLLKVSLFSKFNQIIHSVGLSLSVFMFGGLFLNTILPLIGETKPLTPLNTIIFLNIFTFITGLFSYLKEKNKYFKLIIRNIDYKKILYFIFPILFITQSLAGAQTLNNGGSSILSISLLIEIILYCLFIVLKTKKLNKKLIYPLTIYSISASLLLMISMRSSHIIGWDINQEYYVFQLTKKFSQWSISNFQNPYNSCLSITILPTMLSFLAKINDEYIFKLLYPLLFSFTPVGLYYLAMNFAKEKFAFLSSLMLIFYAPFILEIAMLARQEISLLFFVLILLTYFMKLNILENKKRLLFIVYYFSLVVSHYSTSYIALLLFLTLFLILLMYSKLEVLLLKIFKPSRHYPKVIKKNIQRLLSWKLITLMLLFTLFWNMKASTNSNNLNYVFNKTIGNFSMISTYKYNKDLVRNIISARQWKKFTAQDLNQYIIDKTQIYTATRSDVELYDKKSYLNYSTIPKYPRSIPYKKQVDEHKLYIPSLVSLLIMTSLIVGLFYIFLHKNGKTIIPQDYKILCFTIISLIAIFMTIFSLTKFYNFERLVLQSLIILAFPIILGMNLIFQFLFNKRENKALIASLIVILLLFVSTSGLANQFFGGNAYLQLNNFGEFYDRYYFHDSEKKSLLWLSNNYDNTRFVYADNYAYLKFLPFSTITKNVMLDIIPPVIDKNAYVYSSFSNTNNGIATSFNKSLLEISYNYPNEFLDNNKNVIYSNGDSIIFK